MSKYIKTYELFGGFFSKKDKNKEKEEPKTEPKKEPKVEPKKVPLETQFIELVSKSVEKVKNDFHGLLEIESESHLVQDNSDQIDRVELKIKLSPAYVKRRAYGIDNRDAVIKMSLRLNHSNRYGKSQIMLYHPEHFDKFKLEMKEIISSDLKTSDRFITVMPRSSNSHALRLRYRGLNETELELKDGSIITDANIEIVSKEIQSSIGRQLSNLSSNINDKIKYYKKQEKLVKLNSTSKEEITDIVSDLIDISDDYSVTKGKESYTATFKIKNFKLE